MNWPGRGNSSGWLDGGPAGVLRRRHGFSKLLSCHVSGWSGPKIRTSLLSRRLASSLAILCQTLALGPREAPGEPDFSDRWLISPWPATRSPQDEGKGGGYGGRSEREGGEQMASARSPSSPDAFQNTAFRDQGWWEGRWMRPGRVGDWVDGKGIPPLPA